MKPVINYFQRLCTRQHTRTHSPLSLLLSLPPSLSLPRNVRSMDYCLHKFIPHHTSHNIEKFLLRKAASLANSGADLLEDFRNLLIPFEPGPPDGCLVHKTAQEYLNHCSNNPCDLHDIAHVYIYI